MAEGPALEKRYPVESRIVGSNPTLSAKALSLIVLAISLTYKRESFAKLSFFRDAASGFKF